MPKFIVNITFVTAFTISGLAFANMPMSAKREVGESYREAAHRSFVKLKALQQPPRLGSSVYDLRVQSFDDIDLTKVNDIQSAEKLQSIFESYRDLRYLPDPQDGAFMRRISWMYPDDGCFVRAELLGRLAENDFNPKAAKLFVFGNLRAKTENHPRGEIQWWYHVAAAYRLDDVLYVLDPSVEPLRPLTEKEWGARVGDLGVNGQTTLEWSLCASRAIDPGADCNNPSEETEGDMKSWIEPYLYAERARAVELGRDANLVLGDLPPWIVVSDGSPSPIETIRSP
jgi:hypothetical protein